MLNSEEIAKRGTFLVREVGSSAHGTNLFKESDLDLMGVCFQPPECLLGLNYFEQYRYRSAEERLDHNPESDQRRLGRTPRSQPGDTDLVIYSVQKFLRLALKGNPNVLVLFYSPLRRQEFETAFPLEYYWAESLGWLAKEVASQESGDRFLEYLLNQKQRMQGLKGQMRVTRTELINEFGYDTKYAMQAIRLGLQGIEYMQTGKLILPMNEATSNALKEVRRGELLFHEVVEWIEQLEEDLKQAIDKSGLPKQPRQLLVGNWLEANQLQFFEWYRSQDWVLDKPRL